MSVYDNSNDPYGPDPLDSDYVSEQECTLPLPMQTQMSLEPGVFTPGRFILDPLVLERFVHRAHELSAFAQRHVCGDYGVVDVIRWNTNDGNVMNAQGEVMSTFTLDDGHVLMLVTNVQEGVTRATVRSL